MTSDIGTAFSLEETERAPVSPFPFWFSNGTGAELSLGSAVACLSPPIFPQNSENPRHGLIGEDGAEFKVINEGGEVNDAGARTVKVRSSGVKFEAWSVNTWWFELVR